MLAEFIAIFLDLVDHFEAADDLPENDVDSIKPWGYVGGDVELGGVRVLLAEVGHC